MPSIQRKPFRGSRTGRPIMVLLDLLGRRWTLRIIWELREPLTSRALRERCGDLSPTILQKRVDELRDAGFVALDEPGGYRLTDLGAELLALFLPLHKFADRWLQGEPRRRSESAPSRRPVKRTASRAAR